ncbi:5-oxoprolinase [Brachionus plicatilis]|uniref:5-oxoprolinase n=1 Tax=Brachionus plicatilis TaxID=10195 RepID=A0A3M7SA71_BRAPC|nr:5-oxoprolinase [Brachionus plicatilis]
MSEKNKFKFSIDRGGTFTDVFCITPHGKIITEKFLSENPSNYPDAPTYAIKKIISQETGIPIMDDLIDPENIEWIRMGTTVATNALLEGKGDRFCLVITKGFKDLLFIGNQSRPNLFDLSIQMPKILYDDVIEVDERIIPYSENDSSHDPERIKTLPNGKKIEILKKPNLDRLEQDLIEIKSKKNISNIAVLLLHSYIYNDHEILIEKLAQKLDFSHIALSHKISSMIRAVPRGLTTTIDAYLTPCINRYLKSFTSSFSSEVRVLFMQSDGGLTSINNGPAGGVVGYALTSFSKEEQQAVIGFDMGGTSTDVSRYDGKYEHVFETLTAGYTIQAPQLDINTIAAGGGSMLFFRAGMFVVGPESAGSNPGPACYKNNGPLTITDANLILGRLLPDYFPKIFGKNQNEALDYRGSRKLFQDLTTEINEYQRTKELKEMSLEEVAQGFVKVANEAMCRPIRNLTEGKGFDTRKHLLACFGGAGGQHACAIARSLGIRKILVNRFSGILSAFGLSLADVVVEKQEPFNIFLNELNMNNLVIDQIKALQVQCIKDLVEKENFTTDSIEIEYYLNLRYHGTDTGIMCSPHVYRSSPNDLKHTDFLTSFLERYRTEYGFVLNRDIYVDDIRVRGIGKTKLQDKNLVCVNSRKEGKLDPFDTKNVYFDNHGFISTSLYSIEDVLMKDTIYGPAIIIDKNSTILIEPDCLAYLNDRGDIVIEVLLEIAAHHHPTSTQLDITQLSIFSHRFMSIAEQMGRILQRTSVSTNIKERLDFSCAMFDSNGGLVANAPHIPVHLGAMQEAVKYQIEISKGENAIKSGDVILSNHPACGGSHLPDLTVITPVFYENSDKPVFFVANRGHHADIGGLTPGSMPPTSTKLWQEGAAFKSLKIVQNNVFNEKEIIEGFNAPAQYPNCSGSRNLSDNLSDLKAQIAANKRGIDLITQLIDEYSLKVVLSYMGYIQHTAETSVRSLMKKLSSKCHLEKGDLSYFKAQEFMDDGSNIDLSVEIDKRKGSAIFDFSGTSFQVNGNLNAPKAISLSAIIYCIRCMLNYDIPLNQGCLEPIKIKIPEGCLLSPSDDAAVVGGNVTTSQRIVDLIFKVFQICAASQGCMNNITFGNDRGGYYETVGGGAGAGPGWQGRHGIHTHMTNTRITDVEILENRYPIRLNKFSLRENSGGKGKYNGGNGLIREYVFRDKLKLCVLTERRVFQPYGMAGGLPGARGQNTLVKRNGMHLNLGSKSEIEVDSGVLFLQFSDFI